MSGRAVRRRGPALALALLGGLAAAAPAAARPEAHDHAGMLFQLRVSPELNTDFVYRAFPADGDPARLIVERADGWLGDEGLVDLDAAACPALHRAVAALATLPLPAIFLGDQAPYDMRAPRGVEYAFSGFVRFANGGEGEVSFMAWDVPGRPRDPQLEWMRGVARAFDACQPRRPRRD